MRPLRSVINYVLDKRENYGTRGDSLRLPLHAETWWQLDEIQERLVQNGTAWHVYLTIDREQPELGRPCGLCSLLL